MALLEISTFDGIVVTPADYEELTISTAALGLTAAKINPGGTFPDKRKGVIIVVTAQPINFRIDGTDPTSTVGIPAAAGDIIKLFGEQTLKQFKAIRSGASDATLRVTYFK